MYGMRPTRTLGRLGGPVAGLERSKLAVERVALHRNAPRAADQLEDVVEPHRLRGVRARFVVDLLAHDRSLEIVDTERERHLRYERRDHDPMALDMVDVIEKEPAHGEILEI